MVQMVVYEAARAMVNLKNVTARELQPAVSVLQMFLTSAKPTVRFAAVKTLNRVSSHWIPGGRALELAESLF